MGEVINRVALLRLALLPLLLLARVALGQSADLRWPETTSEAKPWTRWWWMGSAVDSENLTAELKTLAAAGIGGVEVTSIYGVHGYERAFVPYLSDPWIELLLHAAAEARRLGLGLDMPPGSGWRLGGPGVRLEDAVASLRIDVDTVRGTYAANVRPAGDKVKRAAPGGEGNALDPFSRVAVQRYLDAYSDRIKTVPRGTVRAFFHDSFEYTGNGSAELFEEFRRRRGYDLKGYLPALRGEGDRDVVARVKSDYRETMDEMLVEQLFVSGVNHVIYHGTAYSPRDAAWPGWQFYASTELNPRNAIWRDLPALNRYVARVQSILQSGRPDNDVLLYWPIYDNWHDTTGLRSDFEVQQPAWLHGKPVGAVARVLWQRSPTADRSCR